jgi:hypothetical protein
MDEIEVFVIERGSKTAVRGWWFESVTVYRKVDGTFVEEETKDTRRFEYPMPKIRLTDGRVVYGADVRWGRLERR